jgi:beta-glucosidase
VCCHIDLPHFDRIKMAYAVAALVAAALAGAASAQPFPWYNTSLSFSDRVSALIGAMTQDELISQSGHEAPAITRLGLPSYSWWTEALHGQAWAGVATVFPEVRAARWQRTS